MLNATALAELLAPLPVGTRVTVPDGERGYVVGQDGSDVYVVMPGRIVGRGPWIFARYQLEVAL